MERNSKAYDAAEIVKAVKAYREGNAEAFDMIYEQSSTYLRRYAMYLTKDYSAAEDLMQDTYMRIINHINNIDDDAAFMPWARTIMYNLAIQEFRKSSRVFACEDEALEAFQDEQSDEKSPEEIYELNESKSVIDSAIDRLPVKQGNVVKQYYFEYRSVGWIASHEKLSEGTVKTRLFNARKNLKAALSEYVN